MSKTDMPMASRKSLEAIGCRIRNRFSVVDVFSMSHSND
jgi:hypothetical protein